MAVARPDGSVPVGSLFYELTSGTADTPYYAYFIIRTPPMPAHWTTDDKVNLLPRRTINRQQIVYGTGEYLQEKWYGGGWSINIDNTVSGQATATPVNSENTEAGRVPARTLSSYPGSGAPTFVLIEVEWQKSSTESGDRIEVLAVSFETENDDAYDGDKLELTEPDPSIWVYQPDYPCSAWHIQCLCVQTMNKILHENLPRFSIPMIGDLSDTISET